MHIQHDVREACALQNGWIFRKFLKGGVIFNLKSFIAIIFGFKNRNFGYKFPEKKTWNGGGGGVISDLKNFIANLALV